MNDTGLVLSGGGARAAYQAGVLVAIADICAELKIENPFQIYSGISAGAINASMLVATPLNFKDAVLQLSDLWGRLNSDQVYRSNPFSLTAGGLKWMAELSMGGLIHTPGISLLDTAPLSELVNQNCKFDEIKKKIQAKKLRGIAVSALDYFSTSTVTFMHGQKDIQNWKRIRRKSETTQLHAQHVLASAAIPLLFPPIKIGDNYYGDGSIRNLSPSSPAISMGARRLIAIGVRRPEENCYNCPTSRMNSPTLARVVNVLMHAVMMDGLELDFERIQRINQNLAHLKPEELKSFSVQKIDCLWISPSRDLAELAVQKSENLPRMIRYLLKGLGSLSEASELTSFILFEPTYCRSLLEIGFEDGMKARDRIRHFLSAEPELVKPQILNH